MDLTHEFEVPLSIDEAWSVLTDLERVAPCLPGAQLDEVEGDEYRGRVKIKVGPITVEYKGTATFLERLVDTHVAVLRAAGRETKGQGSASATVTATLEADGANNTKVNVLTVLDVSGRVAQFGRGALADVSSKILGQFAQNLEKDLAAGGGAAKTTATAPSAEAAPAETAAKPPARRTAAKNGSAPSAEAPEAEPAEAEPAEAEPAEAEQAAAEAPAPAPVIRKIDSAPVEPVRVVGLAGVMLLKRLSPIAALGVVALWLRRRRRKHAA
jgi:carbon monoxide dehydrogenase subunit G